MCVATNSGCRNTSLPPEFNSGEQRLPTHSCEATSLTSVLKLDSRKENEVFTWVLDEHTFSIKPKVQIDEAFF